MKKIASRLRTARKYKTMSKKALAKRTGIPLEKIKKYEKGVATLPSWHLLLIAKALQVRTEYFFRAPVGNIKIDRFIVHGVDGWHTFKTSSAHLGKYSSE